MRASSLAGQSTSEQPKTILASTTISPQGGLTEDIGLAGNSTAPVLRSQKSDDSAWQSDHHEAEQPAHYLYFLVCAASTGDQEGLFKMGITDHLPNRYRQHSKVWEGFDLYRSARLVGNERDIKFLEGHLKKRFKKWRRYPGRNDAGHTEFFDVDGLAEILALVQSLSDLGIGAHLSRGIDPAECATPSRADGMSALARKQLGEARAQQNALRAQERAERGEHITLELKWVLLLAEGWYRNHLVWVNLNPWHQLQDFGERAPRKDKTLVDLYFGRFHPEHPHIETEAGEQCITQASFAEGVECIQRSAVTQHTASLKYRPNAMFHLREPLVHPGDQLPHPVCADTLLLRVECGQYIPLHPFLAKFEALAQKVGSYRNLEQSTFDW